MTFTHEEASKNILAAVSEGRLIQGIWHTARDGRAMACLLGSIHPTVSSPAQCNGDLMPSWLAELTPILFDKLPFYKINEIGERYGRLVGRWHVLTKISWDSVLNAFLIRVVDEALDAASKVNTDSASYWSAVKAACAKVKQALMSGVGLDAAAADARDAARAADAGARAAAYAAAYAAYAAAYAAYAAYAARAARAAAYAAADAAADAADAAYAAAGAVAAYNLFVFLLDLIEKEIEDNRPVDRR